MDDMVKRFLASGRTGFYFAVSREGEVGAGDELNVVGRDPNGVPVSEITRLYIAKSYGDDDLSFVAACFASCCVAGELEGVFRERLERAGIAAE